MHQDEPGEAGAQALKAFLIALEEGLNVRIRVKVNIAKFQHGNVCMLPDTVHEQFFKVLYFGQGLHVFPHEAVDDAGVFKSGGGVAVEGPLGEGATYFTKSVQNILSHRLVGEEDAFVIQTLFFLLREGGEGDGDGFGGLAGQPGGGQGQQEGEEEGR